MAYISVRRRCRRVRDFAAPATRRSLARKIRHSRENPKSRKPETPAPTYPMLRVPLQSGQPVQLQNSLPAFSPRFATRLRIGLPHFGHFGASPAIAWAASRAARFIVLVFLLRFCHNSSRIQRKAENRPQHSEESLRARRDESHESRPIHHGELQ